MHNKFNLLPVGLFVVAAAMSVSLSSPVRASVVTAVNDGPFDVLENSGANDLGSIAGNDSCPAGDTCELEGYDPSGLKGSVSFTSSASPGSSFNPIVDVTFTPTPGFHGITTFTYFDADITILLGLPDGGICSMENNCESNSATVTIDVEEVATPLPATLPFFATGLAGIGLLARRRKRKAVALAA
jgi:Bacterial Ig domain